MPRRKKEDGPKITFTGIDGKERETLTADIESVRPCFVKNWYEKGGPQMGSIVRLETGEEVRCNLLEEEIKALVKEAGGRITDRKS